MCLLCCLFLDASKVSKNHHFFIVHLIIFFFEFFTVGISGVLWRTPNSPAMNSATLSQAGYSNMQNNYLSCCILTLGGLLITLALIGIGTAKRVGGSGQEEVKASRHGVTKGFLLMVVYLQLTIAMFLIFLFATLWFTLFNAGPAQWMESTYFQKKAG